MFSLEYYFLIFLFSDVTLAAKDRVCQIPIPLDVSIQEFIEMNCKGNATDLMIEGNALTQTTFLEPQTLDRFQAICIKSTDMQRLGTVFNNGPLKNLIKLELTNNRIQQLDDNTFAATTSLTVLNVSNNVLNALDEDCFAGLTALEVLDLSDNCISCLPDKVFMSMPNLVELRLADNRLDTMSLNIFKGNLRLKVLSLDRNYIESVEPASNKLAIEQLGLQDNNLTNIFGLKSLVQLGVLDLSENPNIDFKNFSFEGLSNLKRLDLSNVSLNRVESLKIFFSSLESVENFIMERNGLKKDAWIIWGLDGMKNTKDEFSKALGDFTQKFLESQGTQLQRIYVRNFKECSKFDCKTAQNFPKASIITVLSLAILFVICAVLVLVSYCLVRSGRAQNDLSDQRLKTVSSPKKPLPEGDFVETNFIYEHQRPLSYGVDDGELMEEPGYETIP